MLIKIFKDAIKGFRVRVVDADGLTLRTYPTIESPQGREGMDRRLWQIAR